MAYIYTPIGVRTQAIFGGSPGKFVAQNGATGALIQALTQNVRISLDAAAPATASDGIQIKAGDPVRYIPVGAGGSFTYQQETSGAAFYLQPVRLDWIEP